MNKQSIGATPAGLQWLLNKAVVQTTATLNLAVYLMLKREAITHGQDPAMMQTHPIMAHLQKWNTTLGQIQDVEAQHGLAEQMRHVVRAASFLSGDAISVSSNDDGDESNSGDNNSSSEDDEDNVHVGKDVEETGNVEGSLLAGGSDDSSSSEDDGDDDDEDSPSDEEDDDETERARSVLTEARFGLRPNEVANHNESGRKRRRAVMLDAGDDDDQVVTAAAAANAKQKAKKSKSSLAGTLNSIEQRTANKTKKSMQATEEVDDDTKIRRGLEMMEEELGPASDDEGNPNTKDNADKKERGRAGKEDEGDDDNNNEFYDKLSKRSQAHRDYKKQLHAVAPKFPRVDGMVAGERAASRHIIKNRGLVAHKKKINRNPRVKKREQFRKALIRRKGAVREVRTNEGHRYGGEETGIKTNLSRSRKLA
jgi:U3 small nucleolar RNA-associated protein 3